MDLILPAGTRLFHGTSEPFPVAEIRGGGYDNVIWTADNSVIAQTYIPLSGVSSITGPEEISRPSKDPIIQQIQRLIGVHYDLSDVEWDYMDRATSYRIPEGWDHIPEYDEIHELLQAAGWEPSAYGHYHLRYDYEEGPERRQPRLFAPGEKLVGRLFIFETVEPLRIYDYTLGGEREGDLMNVDYHNIPLFRKVEAHGYDGIKINDFAQTQYWGNLGHTSIGIFNQALPKLRWQAIPATNFDWDEDTPLDIQDTPEYAAWLETL